MRRKLLAFFCVLFLAAIDDPGAQAATPRTGAVDSQLARSGTWSATRSRGPALVGTWTALPDSTGGAVTGTWTLVDAEGRTVAQGGWSASKSAARWDGAWRAVIAGREGEFSGTWTATLAGGRGRFADLFEKAAETVVSGTWRAGGGSGAWSIRAVARAATP